MKFTTDRIQKLVRGHDHRMRERREEWDRFRAAHDGRMWDAGRHKWADLFALSGQEDPLPVKVQVNLVKPFVQRHRAALFYRSPRTEVLLPAVSNVRSGAISGEKVDAIRAVGDDWLRRKNVQDAALHALALALMYPGAAFKVGWNPKVKRGTPIDRIFLDVLPCWEVMWDERAKLERSQRYRGHIRYETVEEALELLDMTALPDGIQTSTLPDFVREEWGVDAGERERRDDGYVRVLEFYDMVDCQQRWFLVTGERDSATLHEGPSREMPYDWADGTDAIPLIPIILENVPEHPFEALAPVREVYENAAEQSLLLSVVANAMRVDAARVVFFLKERGLSDEVITKLRNAVSSLEFIEIDASTLEGLTAALQVPSLAPSLDKYKAWLDLARQDSTTTSDLATGKQGKYLSATEAQVLSAGDEQASSEPQARMATALGQCAALAFRIMTAEARGGMKVRVGKESVTLTKADLGEAWTIYVIDAASSPTKALQRQQQFLTVQQPLLELAKLSADEPAPPPGAPAPPPIPEAVKSLARAMLNYTVDLWDLPENFRWEAISNVEEAKADPRVDALMAPPQVETPALPAPPAEMQQQGQPPMPSDEEFQAMVSALTPEQLAALQQRVQGGQ